jgi:hypothetical protein
VDVSVANGIGIPVEVAVGVHAVAVNIAMMVGGGIFVGIFAVGVQGPRPNHGH